MTDSTVQRTSEQQREGLRQKVRYFYDIQRLRIQVEMRTIDRPAGQKPHLHPADVALLKARAEGLRKIEAEALKDVKDHLKTIPFWVEVLSDRSRFKGIGPAMAGVILSEFDIFRTETPSQMWAFCGLSLVPAVRCRKCQAVVELAEMRATGAVYRHKKERSRSPVKPEADGAPRCELAELFIGEKEVFASGRAMRPVKGEKLPYNSWLRAKLMGVLAPVLLQVGSPWRKFYDDYKHRKASAGWGRSDAHRHQAAMRYMIKQLLLQIWKDWREFEGLPVRPSYQEQYLGHVHGCTSKATKESDPGIAAELATLE